MRAIPLPIRNDEPPGGEGGVSMRVSRVGDNRLRNSLGVFWVDSFPATGRTPTDPSSTKWIASPVCGESTHRDMSSQDRFRLAPRYCSVFLFKRRMNTTTPVKTANAALASRRILNLLLDVVAELGPRRVNYEKSSIPRFLEVAKQHRGVKLHCRFSF